VRQIINYCLGKVKNEWQIEINAFSMDIHKVLQCAEIIKTRMPFLHQENKMLSQSKEVILKARDENEEDATITRIYSGLSIILSRNEFKVECQAGYQRPKPRQFVSQPSRGKYEGKKAEVQEDLKKPKSS
jgi:hypothetical protein